MVIFFLWYFTKITLREMVTNENENDGVRSGNCMKQIAGGPRRIAESGKRMLAKRFKRDRCPRNSNGERKRRTRGRVFGVTRLPRRLTVLTDV